jgi:catabolite regulation protein CreA
VIVTDYLKSPKVDLIDLEDFGGLLGDRIKVEATDDCEVTGVTVEVRAEDDTLLEKGAATYSVASLAWVYATTVAHPPGTPVTITATAVDRPGNKGTLTTTWPVAG